MIRQTNATSEPTCPAIGGLENASFPESRSASIENVSIRRVEGYRENRPLLQSSIGSFPGISSARALEQASGSAGVDDQRIGRFYDDARRPPSQRQEAQQTPTLACVGAFEDALRSSGIDDLRIRRSDSEAWFKSVWRSYWKPIRAAIGALGHASIQAARINRLLIDSVYRQTQDWPGQPGH